MSNVIQFKDLQSEAERLKKIKGLRDAIKDWKQILNVKESYLNSLRLFVNYASIMAECKKVNIQIIDIESRLRSMKEQLSLLSKESE